MRLYLVRHAEAARGEPDDLRPLTPAGREAARALGARLARRRVRARPCSRARCSAPARPRPSCAAPSSCEPEADERLAPGATAEDVRAAVAGRGDEVVVVGHQPDCGLIAAALGGGPEPAFPPGGLAVLEL